MVLVLVGLILITFKSDQSDSFTRNALHLIISWLASFPLKSMVLSSASLLKILSWWLVEFVVVKMEILVDMVEIMTDKLESVMAKMAHGGE